MSFQGLKFGHDFHKKHGRYGYFQKKTETNQIYMGASQKSGMDRSAVIRTMDRECLRKVPDPCRTLSTGLTIAYKLC